MIAVAPPELVISQHSQGCLVTSSTARCFSAMASTAGSISWYVVLVMFFVLLSVVTYSWRRCAFVDVVPPEARLASQRRANATAAAKIALTKEQLERLPTFTIPPDAQAVEEGELECAICQDTMVGREVALLPCGHVFDQGCVREWLSQKATCPTCRLEVTEELLQDPSTFRCRTQNQTTDAARIATTDSRAASSSTAQHLSIQRNLEAGIGSQSAAGSLCVCNKQIHSSLLLLCSTSHIAFRKMQFAGLAWCLALLCFFLVMFMIIFGWRRFASLDRSPEYLRQMLPTQHPAPADQPKQAPLPIEQQDRLPCFVVPADAQAVENSDLHCAICQDSMIAKKAALLPCGHCYHEGCVRAWLSQKATCPTCRLIITEEFMLDPSTFRCHMKFTSADR
ncbi:hypothetical protein WJX72_007498 [[Myrmecia] bisecta]|uniref:RING-type domain-containing protein n=1 Tax=[Myrmecia] bisecta TaxID=41462 RepID=A0AAW1P4W3_9CHLO